MFLQRMLKPFSLEAYAFPAAGCMLLESLLQRRALFNCKSFQFPRSADDD